MPITPNMNINEPTPGADDGVWGQELNTGLGVIDGHDHTPGKGVLVPVAGLNIDDNLDLNAHRLTNVAAVQVNPQVSAITGSLNANAAQSVNGDLYWTNGSGVPVQVTSGSSVASTVSANTPPGMVVSYAGTSAPAGYLITNGAAVSRSTFANLFAVIGTLYGPGDGTTTFNIPNLQGRVPVGAGTYTDPTIGSVTRTLATVDGEASHAQTQTEMANHNHNATVTIIDPGHVHGAQQDNGPVPTSPSIVVPYATSSFPESRVGIVDTHTTGITATSSIQSKGSGGPANVMQPFVVLNYIIKT